ncbi:MAG: fatty-acid oxidation protein subunit alpha [Epsilonproteobacteria bacterium]|nr:MAG: fatty-acid oxidation protein subunit alpha [Campylobacterota bacterium]
MKNLHYFNLEIDKRGIATLVFDTAESTINVLCFDALYELEKHLEKIHKNKKIKALFIQSAKEHIFIAGADIKEIKAFENAEDTIEKLRHGQAIFNKLENLPFPTIAVIDGACLGGGLELALACDYRIATNAEHTRIGLVEVSLGIIPGLGGTQRLAPLVGYAKAIELISASKRLKGDKALRLGLVDASVPSGYLAFKKEEYIKEILAGTLKSKIAKTRKGLKWYEKFFLVKMLIASIARKQVIKQTAGQYPAPLEAIDVIEQTLNMSLEDGLEVELEIFGKLSTSAISKNLIELFFISEALKKETFSTGAMQSIDTASVIGVGTMGSGIAWALAHKDIPLRLVARKMQSISRAISNMMKSFDSIRRRGRLTNREIGLKMDRVTYTTEMLGLGQSDILIEAVSEDPMVKKQIYTHLEEKARDDAIIATNTSSLNISTLVKDCKYPERFVGMHFFNPVAKMPLVEIIAGEKTSEDTIATVVKLAKRLGKTPIKVKECAGFLVNRILLPYLSEASKMFEEGEDIERMDALLKSFGMPMGPFVLVDEVGVDIGEKVSMILYDAYGERMKPTGVLEKMIDKKWLGKKTGIGFYRHKGKNKTLNSDVLSLQKGKSKLEDKQIIDRAILIMVNEAARCLEENVVDNAQYLDMAMVMGTGFPAFRGGLLRYADSEGLKNIVTRLRKLEKEYGERFTPASLLVKMSKEDKYFYV